MIRDNSIEDVKMRIDIVDVISDFVDLKKAGANYKAISPFTDEKTPSFFVSPAKNLYKCFSSQKGGDAINFIMELEGFTFTEAIRYLARKYQVELDESEDGETLVDKNDREAQLIALKFANELYQNLLWNHPDGKSIGLSYFKERGLDERTIKRFELGFSIEEWDYLLKEAMKAGYKEDILEKAGLVIRKDEKRVYDRFRNRTIFPIHNVTGRVVGFGARQIKNEKKQPKYINSPESDVYNKSRILYGLHQAKQSIRNKDLCYLVEGYMDVIALCQGGVDNVVSSSGTSLTEEQIALIGRYTKNISVLYDGDAAGLRAAARGLDMIIEQGMNGRVVLFPEGHDPDSYMGEVGSKEFEEYVQSNGMDFIDFKKEIHRREGDGSAESKVAAIRDVVESISKISDSIARSVFIKQAANGFDLDESVFYAEVNKLILQRRKRDKMRGGGEDLAKQQKEQEISFIQPEETALNLDEIIKVQERECLRLLVNFGLEPVEDHEFYYRYFFTETEDIDYLDSDVEKLINLYKETLDDGKEPTMEYLAESGDDKIRNMVADLYFKKYELSENWELMKDIKVLEEIKMLDIVFPRNILLLKYRNVSRQVKILLEELKEANKEDENEIMDQYIHLKHFQTEFARELGIVVDGI